MRLIDADVLERTLVEAQAECKKNGGNFRFGVLSNVRANVADAPTIDAIPVEWLMDLANRGDFVYGAVARWKQKQEAR